MNPAKTFQRDSKIENGGNESKQRSSINKNHSKQKSVTKADISYDDLMKFNLDDDITFFNYRLDRLKRQQQKVKEYFKQSKQNFGEQQQGGGILKQTGGIDTLPIIELGSTQNRGFNNTSRRNTISMVPKVRFKLDDEELQ